VKIDPLHTKNGVWLFAKPMIVLSSKRRQSNLQEKKKHWWFYWTLT